ncbi:metallophosphoesterase [Pontibacter locisalis]|uniref:Metallophosphoesterase n=1 Tax=Pontibacter locisalis TaxID=1719035 RepID=A0ABW5IMJ1_9BACT
MDKKKSNSGKLKIAAVGDIHVHDTDQGKWTDFFKEVSAKADVLLLCGDLTDTGKESEAEVLAEELRACSIPVLAVLGNHDYEGDQVKKLQKIFARTQLQLLDGDFKVIENVGFAGVKGYGGGFDKYTLGMFGEKLNKDFVQETVNEALKLDAALAQLDSEHSDLKKVVLLHYAPIKSTVEGEPEAIHPFLGCSRLEEPLNRRNVTAAFHGHAHIGKLEGKTATGVRVFNVSKPVLQQNGYETPFYLLEV